MTDQLPADLQARKQEAEVRKLEAEAAKSQAEAAKAQADASKASTDAQLAAAQARGAQIGGLIPDLGAVKPSTLDVKDGPPIGGSILAFDALRSVGESIADCILAIHEAETPWRVLVTSDTDLATSDSTYADVKSGLTQLDEAAEHLLKGLVPEAPRFAPIVVDVVGALASALPGLLSMLSAQRSLATAAVTVNDLAAVAAVSGGLLRKKAQRNISIFEDDFRVVPEGGVYAASAQLSGKRQQLMGHKIALMKKNDDLAADLAAAENKEELHRQLADVTVRLAMIDSLTSSIEQFQSAVRLVPEGAHRSPVATAALRENLHPATDGFEAFSHSLLVKGQAGQSQQLVENRPLWFKDTFSTVVDVSVTFTLIRLPVSNVVAAGTVTGTAKAFGKIGDKPEVAITALV